MKTALLLLSSFLIYSLATAQDGEFLEDFENGQTIGSQTFINNGTTFNVNGDWVIDNFPGFGYGPNTNPSDWYIDNFSENCDKTSINEVVGGISTQDGSEINVNSVWLYASEDCSSRNNGNITVRWFKDGILEKEISYLVNSLAASSTNGYFQLDFNADGNSCIATDSIQFQLGNDIVYLALDNFSWSKLIDKSVTQDVNTLTANDLSATSTFEWLDCNNNNSTIGVTDKSYIANELGNYSVEITKNQCIDTSNCYEVSDIVGIVNSIDESFKINIFPNPSLDKISIDIPSKLTSAKVSIYNELGEEIKRFDMQNSTSEINTEEFEPGVYFINIVSNNESSSTKFIKL